MQWLSQTLLYGVLVRSLVATFSLMITLKVPGLQKPCSINLIIWIEGDGNYAWVHFTDRPKFLSTQTLKWFAHRLPSFLRVHKSSLINADHLAKFEWIRARRGQVILSNGMTLVVARRRVQPIANQLGIIFGD